MDASEIEQFARAMKAMTPDEVAALTAIVGPDLVATVQAAIEGLDNAYAEAGEQIAHEAQKHLHDDD